VSLRLPILLAGAVSIALGAGLIVAMSETAFVRADAGGRWSWRQFSDNVRSGGLVVRRSRVLVLIAVFIVVAGGSSEAFDRYTEKHLLDIVGVPGVLGHGPILTLAILFTTSSLLGVVVPLIVARLDPARERARVTSWLVVLTLVQVAALVVFGLTGRFVVAAVAVLVIRRVRSVRDSLFASWIVPLTPKAERATVLSTMSQFDAIGQVAVGPGFGAIGRWASVPTALVTSAVVLAPGAAIIAAAGNADRRDE
jgi:DHA3 family tetracycline resistance protein-like MFS transporter